MSFREEISSCMFISSMLPRYQGVHLEIYRYQNDLCCLILVIGDGHAHGPEHL